MAKEKNSEPEAGRSLLESLNSVAASLQLMIQSEDDIYHAFGDGVAELGLRGGISKLDDSGSSLTFRALGYSKKMQRAMAGLEKLTGLKIAQFSVKIEDVDAYRNVIEKRMTVYAKNSSGVISQMLGGKSKRVVEKVLSVFSDVPVIYAPLIAREKVLGIVNIAGLSLTEEDISTIESFALQLSIALENARLFSALQASEETHRTLVNTSPDAVTMTDLDGNISFVSPQTLELHGADSSEDMIGRSALELVAPEDREKAAANLGKTLTEGVVRDVEYTLVRADGTRFPGELNAALIRGQDGEPSAFIATTRDITERKRLQQIYQGLVDQGLVGFVVMQDGRIVFSNDAFCGITGYSNQELLGLPTDEVEAMIHPEDREMAWSIFRRRLAGEDAPPRHSYRGIRKDGSVYWLEMVATRTEHDGMPAIQGAILDITDRVLAQEVLKESEEKLRDIYTNVTDILYFHDLDGNFIEANLFYKQEMGYTEEDIRKLGVRGLIPEQYRHEFDDYIKELVKAGGAQGLMRLSTKDGEERIVEYRNTLVSDDSGPIGVRGSARDITDRLRIERELRNSEARYRSFLTNFQGIAFRANPEDVSRPFFLHGKVEEICGYSIEDFSSGKITWIGMLHPEDRRKVLLAIKRLRDIPDRSTQLECRIVRKDGEERWIQVLIQNVSEDGAPVGVHGAIYDVTERKKAEERLRISEENYRTLVDNVRIGVYRTSGRGAGRFLHANPAMAEIFGYGTAEEIMKINVTDLYQNPSERKALLDEVKARGFVRDREFLLQKKDGAQFWASLNVTAKFNAQGEVDWLDGVIEDITERKRAEERLLRDAFYDELTGLPNRALLIDRLDRAIERSKRRDDYHCAVLFMDLDRFKVVNDSLGHAMGDKLLVSVAGRLENILRSGDTVARWGGDEFVILLEELKENNRATTIADRIREELNTSHNLDGHDVFTSGSIGVVVTVQGYAQPADALRDADIAMYGAKQAGKDRYQIFDPAMHELALKRMEIETQLRQALANDELRVHYQPIVMMETGKLLGFEALIRWEHPERGIILPEEFFPIMEETGLIIQAGRWVMMTACKQARQWNKKYPDLAPLAMSVNLSGVEFTHPELGDNVREALEVSGLDPQCMTIEITEGVIMSDPEQARLVLDELGRLGVQIHLDDFGTGYSSLEKLGQFRIDKLKIDRTFIKQIEGDRGEAAIVETILDLARSLEMGAIAEGVETKRQFDYLKASGCQYCQGYFIAHPMDEKKSDAFIKAKKIKSNRIGQP